MPRRREALLLAAIALMVLISLVVTSWFPGARRATRIATMVHDQDAVAVTLPQAFVRSRLDDSNWSAPNERPLAADASDTDRITVRGLVLTSDGSPLPDTCVVAAWRSDTSIAGINTTVGSGNGVVTAAPLANGSFVLLLPKSDRSYRIGAASYGWSPIALPAIPATADTSVELTLWRVYAAVVRFREASDRPLPRSLNFASLARDGMVGSGPSRPVTPGSIDAMLAGLIEPQTDASDPDDWRRFVFVDDHEEAPDFDHQVGRAASGPIP